MGNSPSATCTESHSTLSRRNTLAPYTLRLGRALQVSLLIGTCLSTHAGSSWAGPEGGVVSGGSATIGQSGNTTTINQGSDRVLIDWNSFNVDQHERVDFVQAGAHAVAVNRIHDANPSTILGTLNANGQIILINPNGVTFGASAKVDVNGLVVSTSSPTDGDASGFVSGALDKLKLAVTGNPDARIINNGMITARDAGLVGFVAPNIINHGIIVANKGSVQMAGADLATIDLYGDGLIDLAVSDAVKQQLIDQKGWVQAQGGKVIITAAAGEQIVNSVINMGGVTQAHSIDQVNGKIILKGDPAKTKINVSGTLDVSGRNAGQSGGSVTVTGKAVTLAAGSVVDASGDTGGGTIKIGGDYKGQGVMPTAQTVLMEGGATIHNDAVTSGHGGTTILWSDELTDFGGLITGQGGALGGAGGFLETSGKADLKVTGHVDLSSSDGHFGTWLLDPTNITIYNRAQGGTDNVNTVTTAYLEGQGANINLVADNDIIFDMTGDTLTLGSSRSFSATATSGNITSASAGTITTNGNISLSAGGSINFSSPVALNAGGDVNLSSVGNMNLSAITTKNIIATATGAGSKITASSIATGTGGNITLTADDLTLNGNLSGTGTLTLQPYADTRIVRVNDGSDDGTNLHLSGTEIGRLVDGWSLINVGSLTSTADLYIGTSTWNDPTMFRNTHRATILDGHTLTGAGNASFAFTSQGWIDLRGNITTNNQSVVFSRLSYGYGGTINTNGGSVSFSQIGMAGSTVGTNLLTVNTGGGNISFANTIGTVNGSTAGKSVTLNAGSGTVAFNGTVDGAQDMIVTGGLITLGNVWGGNLALGNLTLTSTGNLTLQSITMQNGSTLLANVTGNGNRITASTISAGIGSHVTLTADDVTLNGNISGTGTLTLQPNSNSRVVRVIDGSGDFHLDGTELGNLADGWGLITIGRATSTADFRIYNPTFRDPVVFRTAGYMPIYGDVTGTGNASIFYQAGLIDVYGTTTTNNQSVIFNTNTTSHGGTVVTAGGLLTINGNLGLWYAASPAGFTATTGGGAITINGTIFNNGGSTAGQTVTLNAGTGTVNFGNTVNGQHAMTVTGSSIGFNGSWGGTTGLGNVTLNTVNDVILPGMTLGAGNAFYARVTGVGNSITTSNIATGTGGNITLISDDINVNGILSGTGNLVMRANAAGTLSCIAAYTGSCSNSAHFYLEQHEISRLADGWSGISIGRADSEMIVGNATFTDPTTFMASIVGLRENLVGTGNASFAFNTNNWIDFGGYITTNGGDVSMSRVVGLGGNLDTNGGNYTVSDWYYWLSGDSWRAETDGGNIVLTGGISNSTGLTGKTATLDAGTGAVTIGGVNTDGNVTINGGSITLNGDWGGSTPLGDVSLTSINSLSLPSITTAAGRSVIATVTGAGNRLTTSAIATGSGGHITLTSDDVTIGGNLSGTGNLVLQQHGISVPVYVATGADDGTKYHLNATELSRLVNGWGTITIGSATGNASGYIGASTWTDSVVFRGNYGGFQTTGNLVATDNASITFLLPNASAELGGNITTNGGSVTFNTSTNGAHVGMLSVGHAVISTNGGTVNFNKITMPDQDYGNLTVNSGNGNIVVNDVIANVPYATQAPRTLTFNAGTGTITFGGTVNTDANIVASGQSIAMNGAWGASKGLGNVTLTAVNNLSLPSITTEAGRTLLATVTGAGNRITTASVATGAGGNITLTADDLTIGGALSGTGQLTIRPYSVSREIAINHGVDNNSALYLDTAEVNHIADGWSRINLNRADNMYGTRLGASVWKDPVTFVRGAIFSGGAVVGTGDASFVFDGTAYSYINDVSSSLTTSGGSIEFQSALSNQPYADGGFVVNSNGGAISISSLINDDSSGLTLNSGNGAITVGAITSVGFAKTKSLVFNAGTGTISFTGTVTNNTGTLNVAVNAGTINTNGAWGSVSAPLGTVTLTSINSLSLPSISADTIRAQTTGATADVTLGAGRVLTSANSGTGITLVAKRDFINQNGGNGLVATNGGRWLVYSTNVTGTTGEENLASNFNRYSCTYGGLCPTLGAGNGLLYSYTPLLNVAPIGGVTGTYGQSININGYAYTLSGYLAGEGADTITGSLNGTSNYAVGDNIGTYQLNYGSGTLASALGYGFNYLNNATGVTIGQAALTITANSFAKLFNTSYAFAGNEFTYSGLRTGDTIMSVDLTSAGAANGAAAGSYVINAANASGTGLANYAINYVAGTLTVTNATPPSPIPVDPIPNQVAAAQTQQAAQTTLQSNEAKAKQDEASGCLYNVINASGKPVLSGGCM